MIHSYIPEKNFPIKLDPAVILLGNYFFNLFLIIGEKYTALFEVGVSAIVDTVIHQMDTLLISPDYIIPSHPHSDHMTGLPGLIKRYPKAEVVVASGAKEFITHPKAALLLLKEDAFMSKSLSRFNIRPGRPSLDHVPDLSFSFAVDKKRSIDLGGIILDLIKAEGHSPGNLMGMIHDKKILFCSDSLGFHFPGRRFLPLFFTGAAAYLSTLELMQGFNPRILCPAHQGPLKGLDAAEGIRTSIKITTALIKKIQQAGSADNNLAKDIFEENYKDEFSLYTPENIQNCADLLIKRAKETIAQD